MQTPACRSVLDILCENIMTKIVNLRGTSGSGKSSVAFEMLRQFPHQELKGADGKVKGYSIDASSYGISAPIYLLGKYTTACGGCDQIPTQQEAADRAYKAWNSGGHVLMEGLLASAAGLNGAVTKTITQTGEAVFAILDTPLDVCIERVKKRREARGDERPFNTKNTNDKYTQTHSTAKSLKDAGLDVRYINHVNSFKEVMDIFLQSETQGKKHD